MEKSVSSFRIVFFSIPKPQATAASPSGYTAPTALNFSAITGGAAATIYISVGEGA